MKRFLLLTAAAIMAAFALQAKTPEEVRIYINPGHGSWGPNDRPMATISHPNLSNGMPDTCGFYESNTNLWKCLKLYDVLQNMGVKQENLMMSRVKNGPYPYVAGAADAEDYNRPLSEIAQEVDANNMDMFISIHSNAHVDGYSTNYPAFFYRGYDDHENSGAEGSKAMAQKCWGPHYMDEIDPNSNYSRNSPCIRGDVSFWNGEYYTTQTIKGYFQGYYGVLRHGTPGFLMEGYFHTYQPARHRALNMHYCHQEGVRTARGIQQIFDLNPESIGYIMGTVKDLHQKMANALYTYAPGSIDQWVPLNGAKVELLKNGEVVSTYTTDNNYNGVFVFDDLEPGTYTLRASMNGYKAQGEYTAGTITEEYEQEMATSMGTYTVTANATTYARLYLESENYEPPAVTYTNYPDPVQPGYAKLCDDYVFEQKSAKALNIDGEVRRAIVRGDKIVVLSEKDGEPAIAVYDAATLDKVKDVSINGIAPAEPNNVGFYHRLSDIAFTADDKLVGVNNLVCQINDGYIFDGEQRGTLRFFLWNDLDSDPVEWTTTQFAANWYHAAMGRTLAVSGPSDECTLATTGTTTYGSTATRLLLVKMDGGQQVGTIFTEYNLNAEKQLSENKTGKNFQLMISPRGDNLWVMDGEKSTPYELQPAQTNNVDATITGKLSDDQLSPEANGVGFFKYAGHSLMVSPYVADNNVAGVKLFDITDGLSNAVLIGTEGTDLTPEGSAALREPGDGSLPYMAAGGVVDGLDMTLYLVVGDNVTSFSTKGVEQPLVKGIMAYGLNDTEETGAYTFNFNANSDAKSARIIFYDKETGEELGDIVVPDVKEGANTITVNIEDLPGSIGQEMNWAVNLVGNTIGDYSLINNLNDFNYSYTFNTVDNSPESDYFGRIYIGHRPDNTVPENGLWIYNPDYTRVNSSVINTRSDGKTFASNYRMGIDAEGKVYMPDWGDPTSGVFVFNPAKPNEGFKEFFANEDGSSLSRDGDGLLTNANGVEVAGSTPGVAVVGEGADTKLYVYNEDIFINGFGNNVSVYSIGKSDGTIATTYNQAPDVTYYVGNYQLNTNGNVWPDTEHGGVWVSQYRSAGNNAKGVPSLIYVNSEGTIVYNSGADTEFATLYMNGSNGAGFAIKRDGSQLALNDGSTKICFYDIEWDGDVPTLVFNNKFTPASGIARNGLIYQMNFDYAGNLIMSGAKVGIYSVPNDDNQTTVPAKKALVVVKKNPTGVEQVKTTKTVARVQYVNVAGMVSDKPFDGVNIVVTTYTDGTTEAVKQLR